MSTSYKTVIGDTFESIARKTYGDDRKSINIRKANPAVQEPMAEGINITIPKLPGLPNVLTAASNG